MKTTCTILAVMVLTVSMFTGCGCRNSAPANTSEPTTMPTMETYAPTTQMTTEATTEATTEPTHATIEDGNGPISTDGMATDPSEPGNARTRRGGMTGEAGSGNGITGSITG